MMRKSKRELKRAVSELSEGGRNSEVCVVCGGGPPGTDAREGVTAPFVTIECTCDEPGPKGWTTREDASSEVAGSDGKGGFVEELEPLQEDHR